MVLDLNIKCCCNYQLAQYRSTVCTCWVRKIRLASLFSHKDLFEGQSGLVFVDLEKPSGVGYLFVNAFVVEAVDKVAVLVSAGTKIVVNATCATLADVR